jgi:hypothetical protein
MHITSRLSKSCLVIFDDEGIANHVFFWKYPFSVSTAFWKVFLQIIFHSGRDAFRFWFVRMIPLNSTVKWVVSQLETVVNKSLSTGMGTIDLVIDFSPSFRFSPFIISQVVCQIPILVFGPAEVAIRSSVESLLREKCTPTWLCRQSEEGLSAREPGQIRNTLFRFRRCGEKTG